MLELWNGRSTKNFMICEPIFPHVGKEKEPLKDFADRVRETVQEAFPGLPTAYVEVEVVNRFLKGILAKDAGLHALNSWYENLEKAKEAVQVYIKNQRSVFSQMKIRTVEDQGCNQKEDMAWMRFQRKPGALPQSPVP